MTEVNEEIVRQYLELQGFFVRTDEKYLLKKEETGLKGTGWGDVDILAVHPNGSRYLIEVKGWHMQSFTRSFFGSEPYVSAYAKKKAAEVFGSTDFKTVLVVPEIGSKSRQAVIDLAKKEGIDEVWQFSDILSFLIDNVVVNVNYTSELLQMIRLLKQYLFLPEEILTVMLPDSELESEMKRFAFVEMSDWSRIGRRFTRMARIRSGWVWVEVRSLQHIASNQGAQTADEPKIRGVISDRRTLEDRLNKLLTVLSSLRLV